MITYIKHKFHKKGDTLPRNINEKNEKFDINVKFNINERNERNDINEKNEDDNKKLNNRKSLYETQKALRRSYSNPNFKDFPDTKVNAKDVTNHDKIEFLKEFSLDYGYNGKIDAIRKNEYPHLKGAVYLDHSGSTTYAKSVLTAVCNDLTQNLFGNPHSDNPSSSLSSHRVMQTRLRILKHFDASPDDFEVVFTQNATAALKLVGETFPWVAGRSSFKYLRESHNSLLGIRSLAEAAGLKDISLVLESEIEDLIKQENNQTKNNSVDDDNDYDDDDDDDDDEIIYSLFAYPAQCNFSGQRFPLNWPRRLKKKLDTQKSKLLVLMDAAAYAMTATLSLANKETSPDFMAISFYKMFGYPTGLGALIVKKELFPIMRKKYFGGGSVRAVAYDRPWQRFNPSISEKFEDGTINFLDIIALHHSFTVHEQIYIDYRRIKPHVTSLIIYLTRRMQSFVHWNGLPVCEIYTEREFTDNSRQGPVLNFNVRRADGSWVGTAEVERMASANGIHIRVGGHCNPGCIAKWVNITVDDIMETYAKYGMVCGNGVDYIKEKPAGGVRISLGAMTTIDDILAWLHFFKSYYVEDAPPVNIVRQSVHQQLSPVSRKRSLRNSRSMHQLAPILQTSQILSDDDVESDSEIKSDIEDVPPKQSVHQQLTPIKKSLRNARSMHQLTQTPQTSQIQISPDNDVSFVHSDTKLRTSNMNDTSKISSFIEDVPSYNLVKQSVHQAKNGHSLRNMHQLTQTSQISPDSNAHDVSIVHSDTSNMNETSKISSFIEDVPPYNLVKQSVHQQPSSPAKIGRNLRSMHPLTQTSQISPDNYTNDFGYDTKSSKLSSFIEDVPPYNLVKQSVHQQPSSPAKIGRNLRSMHPLTQTSQISPDSYTNDFGYDTKSSNMNETSKLSSFIEGVPPYNLVKQSVHQQPSSPATIGHGLRNVRSMQQLTPILPVPNGSTHDTYSNSLKLKTLKTIKNKSDRIYHSPELSKKSSIYLINRAYL